MKNFPYKPARIEISSSDGRYLLCFESGHTKCIEYYKIPNTTAYKNKTIALFRFKDNPFKYWICESININGEIHTCLSGKAAELDHIGIRCTYIETNGEVIIKEIQKKKPEL